jgi:putative membrane protein
MNRNSLRAVIFVSILTALVLSINLVVGAQEPKPADPSKPTDTPAQTQTDKTTQTAGAVNSSDKKFVTEAAHGGMKEVELAKLAVTKAASDEVKQYAQRLIDDHTKANDELMQLASQKGITISHDMAMKSDTSSSDAAMKQTSATDPTAKTKDMASSHGATMDKDHKAMMDKMSALSGNQFDKEFIRVAVKDHEKNIKEFEKQSTKANDADVRAFAAKTLPTLQEHLQLARDLDKKLSGSTTNR